MSISRRAFLGFPAALVARPAASGNILVAVQLAGGNDGLNTVVPYEDDHYARRRSTLRLTGSQVRRIAPSTGLHPEMPGFERLFKEGRLAIVQAVGYPKMHRDHGAAMRSWQTANPAPAGEETGWLGRAADQAWNPVEGNVPAVFVGAIGQPLTLRARRTVVPSLREAKEWTLTAEVRGPSPAWTAARRVSTVLQRGPAVAYPNYSLAQSLRNVAQLIRADLGVGVYLVEHGGPPPGGYDNHANQAGHHAVLLRELSESIAAFCADLAGDGWLDRVLLMTYSEFGRTVTENGRHGTNHGAAAPVFMVGGRVKGGLHGAPPDLSKLEGDAPVALIDFRSVYATVLEKWLGLPAEPVLGQRFSLLDLVA